MWLLDMLLTALMLHTVNARRPTPVQVGTVGMPYNFTLIAQTDDALHGYLQFDSNNFVQGENTVMNLNFYLQILSGAQYRIRITDQNSYRWEVPYTLDAMEIGEHQDLLQYSYVAAPFSLKISRKSDSVPVFNLDSSVKFQYNITDIIMVNNLGYNVNVYGLGERVTDFKLGNGNYTLWAKDYTNNSGNGMNMYSSQPFYLATDGTGNAFGGFLCNSNAMEVVIGSQSIEYRTTGGIIDMFVFAGPCPSAVIHQYHEIIGKPVLVPYWSFGWQQSRYGYHDLAEWKNITDSYNNYHIPLDTMWTDIDYMYLYWDFTLDYERYPEVEAQQYIYSLHEEGKHFVPIIDAGVAINVTYPSYMTGLNEGIYMMSAYRDEPVYGKVWPGAATFIDWFHPNATDYWVNQFEQFYKILPIDGVWLDMNEVSNSCNGECWHYPALNFTNMAFTPGGVDLNQKTMDILAKHYTSDPSLQGLYIEYNIHSTYGFLESKATNQWLTQERQVRPFIISRSTFPGHGRYASHWLGDNYSQWDFLKYSIGGVFNFQMFGIPLVGADICGFIGNTTAELCTRWTQLGSLYPFSRNHNDIKSSSQEPWVFGEPYTTDINNAIRLKYRLMQYYYSQYFQLTQQGGTFFRPAFFNYPTDTNLYSLHDTDNFMLGQELLVHPVLTEGATTVDAYFPADTWYDFYTGSQQKITTGATQTLNAPLAGPINMHVRGGSILPLFTNYTNPNVLCSADIQKQGLEIMIALDNSGNANGFVVFDNGNDLNALSPNDQYTWMEYQYSNNTLSIFPKFKGYHKPDTQVPTISQLTIYGLDKVPTGLSNADIDVPIKTTISCSTPSCQIMIEENMPPDELWLLSLVF